MKVLAFILTTSCLLLFLCDPKSSGSIAATAQEAVTPAIKSNPLNAAGFEGKLDELLTLEMAAKVSGFEASKAIKEHENKANAIFGNGKKTPPRECMHLWDSGIGEASTWYSNSNEIKVFSNGLTFTLVVDISDNKSQNRNSSVELARLIISQKLNGTP